MRVRFTNTDSSGAAVTRSRVVTVDGERHTVHVAATGTASVPAAIGEYLVESSDYAVEPYRTDTESGADADTEDTN